jgi:hypothetical protein
MGLLDVPCLLDFFTGGDDSVSSTATSRLRLVVPAMVDGRRTVINNL